MHWPICVHHHRHDTNLLPLFAKPPQVSEFQRRKMLKAESDLNIFKYHAVALGAKYTPPACPLQQGQTFSPIALQVEDKPVVEKEKRSPYTFSRRFTGVLGDERVIGTHADAEEIARWIKNAIDSYGYKNRSYVIEIRTAQAPKGDEFEDWDGDYDKTNIKAGRLASVLEKIEWPVGHKRRIVVYEIIKDNFGIEEQYFKDYDVARKS